MTPPPARLVGVDYGSRRVGVALADPLQLCREMAAHGIHQQGIDYLEVRLDIGFGGPPVRSFCKHDISIAFDLQRDRASSFRPLEQFRNRGALSIPQQIIQLGPCQLPLASNQLGSLDLTADTAEE